MERTMDTLLHHDISTPVHVSSGPGPAQGGPAQGGPAQAAPAQAALFDDGLGLQAVTEHVSVTAQNQMSGKELPPTQRKDRGRGVSFKRRFTKPGVHPFDEVAWERRTASITNTRGEVVFEQKGVEFPAFWSQTATAVVVSKYFRGSLGTPQRESSVRQLIGRVVGTLVQWARQGSYFATENDYEVFDAELTWMLLHQRMAFNSPVWFNLGVEAQPQCSACFINSVDDTMESILTLAPRWPVTRSSSRRWTWAR